LAEIPEHILRRSAEARAKAEGRPVEEIMAEMQGAPAAGEPAAAPDPSAADAPAPASGNGGVDIEALSASTGVPEHILQRAAIARAKADGLPDPTVGGAPSGGGTAVVTAPAPAATAPATPVVPEGVRTQRLLTVVKAGAIQQVKREPTDKVSVWPNLLAIEFLALLVVSVVLIAISIFIDAPLLEFANFNEQPNPSKAPWYFLGLQELLAYFDPQVAGVLIPTLGMVALMFIPYVDKTPSVRPSDRKLAIMIFTFFIVAAAILTIFGSFFRGPGFNFVFPWRDGIFFDDLLDILD
jgi:UDP-N-acetylmuramyl pentapeptide phosphotransferase/UDP-N-acetylglucosamine-1-phosphate transferase